jgi:acetoin utilization deacetylase AcuC-like enzyme
MTLKVGIIRDPTYLEHKTGHSHPEHPRRLGALFEMLDSEFSENLLHIKPLPVTLEQLELVHSAAYIKMVLKTADHPFTSLAPDTPTSRKSYLAAWLAVGGCLQGLNALMSGTCDVCICLVRPPGHHAMPNRAGGFCIFNNLAVVARYAQKRHDLSRILVVDWDVHHGNGLNDIFYHEKEVLYFSSHDKLLYPYSGEWEQTGQGEGEGYTINIPLPRTLNDAEFLELYREVLHPVSLRYRPQLILVAAGFDSHHLDPIGRSKLTEQIFGWLTQLLMELRGRIGDPPIMMALEGGYHPRALVLCLRQVLRNLVAKESEPGYQAVSTRQVKQLVQKVRRVHAKHGVWLD